MAEAGFWRVGLAGEAEMNLAEALGPARVALVLGAEGEGMRQNTRLRIATRWPSCRSATKIESLNVSNAAAIALYAARAAAA
jgi:23S rRNA (guanosine2251-2'-O)-methyltransferase